MVGFLFLAFSSPVLHCKARRKDASVVVFVSGKNGERNPAFGELSAQMRGTGVENASRATCKARRKDASTEQPKNRATLMAFGEIGYEGGLGEVASAAVIG